MNRNDLLKGLECCKQGVGYADGDCMICPYNGPYDCFHTLAGDALEYIHNSEEARKLLVEEADLMLATLKDLPDVVRCGDCQHCYFASNRVKAEQSYACSEHGFNVTPDWFCADGKRKEKEDGDKADFVQYADGTSHP